VHVARTKHTTFQIAKLIEHEQRMIAGAGVMAVPDAHFLLAVGRAYARIHIEHDTSRRAAAVHKVDPLSEKIGKSREVYGRRKPLRLKPAHLARRGRAALSRLTADNPAHCRIVAQAFGIVHVLVAGESTKHRLPQQTDQCMATVPAGARIGEGLARHRAQPECVMSNGPRLSGVAMSLIHRKNGTELS
jgi:hypothetical protein